jgi:hypothetical protein
MTWLETIFRYAPDGGNGSAEALLLMLVIACVAEGARRGARGRSDD